MIARPLLIGLGFMCSVALAQTGGGNNPGANVFGVYVDADGVLSSRAVQTLPAKSGQKQAGLGYVSLAKTMAQAKEAIAAGQEIPDDAKYLGGLTQLRYVMVDEAAGDIVLAGPVEPVNATVPLSARGKLTGRPVLHLDDLVVALRMAQSREPLVLGCSIDPPANSVQIAQDTLKRVGSNDRRKLAEALVEALGPQRVRQFGAPADTRLAMVAVAADYRLKRYSIGLDAPPAGIGNSIDNSRVAGNGFWFEAKYEPLLSTADGATYEIRGPRLVLKCGAVPFDEKGATATAKAFAGRFSEKMNAVAAAEPLVADLQNASDLVLLAGLINMDHLDRKAGLDLGWLLDAKAYPVAPVAIPKTTQTLISFTNGSLAAGGVSLAPAQWLEAKSRETDRAGKLESLRRDRPTTLPVY